MNYPSRHLYLPDALWNGLKSTAKSQNRSVSGLVRELLAGLLPIGKTDAIRNYLPDGQHTRERQEERAIW